MNSAFYLLVAFLLLMAGMSFVPAATADGTSHTATYEGGTTMVTFLPGKARQRTAATSSAMWSITQVREGSVSPIRHTVAVGSITATDDSGEPLAFRVCLTAVGNTRNSGGWLTGNCDNSGNSNTFSHGLASFSNAWRDPVRVLDGNYEWIVVFLCNVDMPNGHGAPIGRHTYTVTTGTVTLQNVPGTIGFSGGAAVCGGGGSSEPTQPTYSHTYSIRIEGSDPDGRVYLYKVLPKPTAARAFIIFAVPMAMGALHRRQPD